MKDRYLLIWPPVATVPGHVNTKKIQVLSLYLLKLLVDCVFIVCPGFHETEEFPQVTLRRSLFLSLELSPGLCHYRPATELGTGLWSYYFRSLLAVGWLLHNSELKVSYREWPLETYYWPLSRWLDVFKDLLHSNRILSHWLYLLLSQESGKKIKRLECLFQRWLISFTQDHQKAMCRLKTGCWWQDFKTGFWARWLKFISSLP